MPEKIKIVINTSPLMAIVAAFGDLTILRSLYDEVFVTFEVCQEIIQGGSAQFAVTEFNRANWLIKQSKSINIAPLLLQSLDLGEASVIQFALNDGIKTVCIDDNIGRKIARSNGLNLIGSLGILLKAKQNDNSISVKDAINNMLAHEIWLSQNIIDVVLKQAGE
jgi:predicted nucleic acid-binding protein